MIMKVSFKNLRSEEGKKRLKSLFIIFILSAAFVPFTYNGNYDSPGRIAMVIFWSFCIFLTQFAGHGYILTTLDKYISWVERPFVRAIVSIFCIMLYASLAFIAVNLIMNYLFFQRIPYDSFQDAIVTLYSNIKSGRLENISSEPEAYLFGMAKNILFNQVKRNSKVNLKEEIDDSVMKNLDYNIYERIDSEYRKNIIQQAFARLADSCRDLLTLFYLEQNSLESIQLKLNYSSIGTVKTRKVQCLIKMRMIVKDLQVHE